MCLKKYLLSIQTIYLNTCLKDIETEKTLPIWPLGLRITNHKLMSFIQIGLVMHFTMPHLPNLILGWRKFQQTEADYYKS